MSGENAFLDHVGDGWHASSDLAGVLCRGRPAGAGRDCGGDAAARINVPRRGTGPEHSLGLDRIVSAVAPRVAPQQAPPREHQAPKYAVLPHRFDRVARARGLVLAAPRDRRRDQPLVERRSALRARPRAQRARRLPERAVRRRAAAPGRSFMPPPPRRLLTRDRPSGSLGARSSRRPARASSSASAASSPRAPRARRARAASGRATTTTSWPGAQVRAPLRAKASRSRRLTLLRSTAPPTLRDTDRPTPRSLRRRVRERVEDELAVGRRAALAVHALELRAAREPAAAASRRPHRVRLAGRTAPTCSLRWRGACVPCRAGA